MKNIINLDEETRIVLEPLNFTLQYRRKSKNKISWRTAGYFPDLTSLCLEHLTSSLLRADNTISSTEELIKVIKEVENNIISNLYKIK